MTDLAGLLRRFLSRYRRAMLTKAALLLGLAAGSIGLLAWRLHVLRWGLLWSAGLPAALACAAGVLGAWWLRRHWMGQEAAAAHLDRVLSLQQRLVTADELAHATAPPPLYPLLLQDLEQRLTGDDVQVPRPVDRATVALATLLLLLLLWPLKGQIPLQQLASLPQTQPPPQTPPDAPPSEPPADQQQQQASSTQGQQGQQSQSNPQPSSSGQDPSDRSPADSQSGQSKQPSEGNDSRSSDASKGSNATRDAAGGRERQSDGRQDAQHAQGNRGGDEQKNQQARDSGDANQSARPGDGDRRAGARQGQALRQRTEGSQQGGGGSSPGQDALKADIQALLKEMQGELKQLQAQLQSTQHAQNEPNPEAGTGTDPELYGSDKPADVARGDALALQLPTDTAPAQSSRRGSGVGTPSGEVSRQGPQVRPDDTATLSEQPLEEQPQARPPVPPEYRDVFHRLSTRKDGDQQTR